MNHVVMKIEPVDAIVTPIPTTDDSTNTEEIYLPNENKFVSLNMKPSKWAVVRAANRRILSRKSIGETKLTNLIDELKKFALVEEEVHENEQLPITTIWGSIQFCRQRLQRILQHPIFQYIIILLVVTDLVIVLVDLVLAQLSSPCLTEQEMEEYNTTVQRDTCLIEHSIHLVRADSFLFYFSALLLAIFVLETFVSCFAFGRKYLLNPLYLLDGIIVLASFVMEMYFHYGNIGRAGRAAAAFIILRLWKIVRAVHAVAQSITLKNRLLIKKIQEAKILLEEEKEHAEQTLEKQEIKLTYFTSLLKALGKLPSTRQMDTYVDDVWKQREKPVV